MTQPIPTVDDVLARTHIGFGLHEWSTDADVFRLTSDELRPALEAAYDPTMPDWPAMVEVDDACPTAPPLTTAPTYEFGYTISAKGEARGCVLKIIGEEDFDLYTATANEENWKEANLPNVKGVYRRFPSRTWYWVRLALRDQVTNA